MKKQPAFSYLEEEAAGLPFLEDGKKDLVTLNSFQGL
jgi:hypothetical protein